MSGSNVSKYAYTHAPELHPHLVVASLQLLLWLFFHPLAWENYIARIDPTLRPDFSLVELTTFQRRYPAMRRLQLIAFVFLPLLVGFVLLLPFFLNQNPNSIAMGMASCIVVSVALSMVVSMALGMCVSVAGGLMLGILSGVSHLMSH